jgi:pimeloyl-ACP methyl ester carboxylesterase
MVDGARRSAAKKPVGPYSQLSASILGVRTKTVVAAGAVAAGVGVLAWQRRQRAPEVEELPTVESLGGEERTIKTADGAQLSVTVAGPPGGRLFVMAHGWTCDRTTWTPVARRLVDRGHRIAIYDQRGHGASKVGEDGFTIEALGHDMRAVLDDLDATGAVIAGHSMGGMAVQSFAVHHPDVLAQRVSGLALVATASEKVVPKGLAARLSHLVLANPAVDKAIASATVGPWLLRGSVGRRPAQAWLESMRTTFAGTSIEARLGFLDAFQTLDLSATLSDVRVPTVVMVGSRDLVIPPARGRRLAQVIEAARLIEFKGAGHMLPYEVPDAVAETLESLP